MTSNADLGELMVKNNSGLSRSTQRTYASLLRNLYYKTTGKDKKEPIDIEWYRDEDAVLDATKDIPANIRKTYLSALIALVGKQNATKYKQEMIKDVKKYDEWVKKQEMTAKQKESWKEYEEVEKVVKEYEEKAKKIMKEEDITKADRKILVDWMILALTTGYYFPPRRSMDYFLMKFRNFDRSTDNFIDKSNFVFNQYKTSKTYNQQTLEIPRSFKILLNKYIKTIPEGIDTLLYDTQNKPLYAVKITQRLNGIFGTKISVSMLRHIYLSSRLKDIPRITELDDLARDMGHSREMQLEYIKHD